MEQLAEVFEHVIDVLPFYSVDVRGHASRLSAPSTQHLLGLSDLFQLVPAQPFVTRLLLYVPQRMTCRNPWVVDDLAVLLSVRTSRY